MTLTQKAELLEIRPNGNEISWACKSSVWCEAKSTTRQNSFSKTGLIAPTVIFTTYKKGISFLNALKRHGQFYFITDIVEKGVFIQLTAAQVNPTECRKIVETTTYNEKKNPVKTVSEALVFPAIRTKIRYGLEDDDVKLRITQNEYIITPKAVTLSEGDILKIAGLDYTVVSVDMLDAYKNQYEICRRGDA